MIDYLIALAVAAFVLLVPQARRTALESLAVAALAAGGVLALALPVWALYQAEPWLPTPAVPQQGAAGGTGQPQEAAPGPADELRRREQERQRQEQREQEQARVADIAATIRGIVERERRYAALSTSRPRLPGVEQLAADLIAIRVPSWRDADLAEREKALIMAWLYAIGLTAEETASIHTANGWGAVYDLWRTENPILAASAPAEPGELAGAPPEAEAESDAVPEPALPPPPEVLTLERPSVAERRLEPPRAEPARDLPPPRRPVPARRPAPEPEVGPFGY
jgi:hypothetical protein